MLVLFRVQRDSEMQWLCATRPSRDFHLWVSHGFRFAVGRKREREDGRKIQSFKPAMLMLLTSLPLILTERFSHVVSPGSKRDWEMFLVGAVSSAKTLNYYKGVGRGRDSRGKV